VSDADGANRLATNGERMNDNYFNVRAGRRLTGLDIGNAVGTGRWGTNFPPLNVTNSATAPSVTCSAAGKLEAVGFAYA